MVKKRQNGTLRRGKYVGTCSDDNTPTMDIVCTGHFNLTGDLCDKLVI